MNIENWFSTPILYHSLRGDILNDVQKEIEESLSDVMSKDLTNPWGDGVKTSFKYGNNDYIRDYKIKTLEKIVIELSWHFLSKFNQYNFYDYQLTDSWINFSEHRDFQFEHSHNSLESTNNNILSGVYYYQTNGNDGCIEFISPNLLQSTSMTPFGEGKVVYEPKVGKILLFPSWLRHRVQMNNTQDTRISVTFNIGNINK